MTRHLDILRKMARLPEGDETSSGARERRSVRRLDCRFSVRCSLQSQSFGALVHNVSEGGLQMTVPFEVTPGTILVLRGKTEGMADGIHVRILWCRGYAGLHRHEVGALFVDPRGASLEAWIRQVMADRPKGDRPEGDVEMREHYRAPVLAPVQAEVTRPSRLPVIRGAVTNISRSGCLFETCAALTLGERLVLTVTLGTSIRLVLRGRVIRCTPATPCSSVGIAFEDVDSRQAGQLENLVNRLATVRVSRST